MTEATERLLERVVARAAMVRRLRDEGWPEPRTVDDLRRDSRVRLENRLGGCEDVELAMALMLVVAEDYEALDRAAATSAG